MGVVNPYPLQTWTLASADGNILVIENPVSNLRMDLSSLTTLATLGRCKVTDETFPGSISSEVFWKDHRNINGYYRISNGVLRYTIQEGGGVSPLIEVWSGSAWVTIGNYQMQTVNAGTVLPLQTVNFTIISPEEIIWTERRFDTGGTALVVVTNRIRRGHRLIESQILAASGAGLTGTQSIGIVGAVAGTWAAATSGDSTGVAFTQAALQVPGFCFLTTPPAAASVSTTNLYSGATVPAGTVTRLAVLAGYQDAMFTSLATAAAYAQRFANYNRTRVRQRLLVA
jgi:hypothetical protein